MRAAGLPAAVLVALALGLPAGCATQEDSHCAAVYGQYVRQGELEALHEQGAAAAGAAEAGGLGSDRSAEEEAALAAREAGLQLVLDNPQCFSTWDVREARTSLPDVQEQLAEHRAG